MAAYASAEDIRDALAPDASRRVGTAAELGDDALNARATSASLEVDGALSAAGYAVPIAGDVPQLVRDVTAALAGYQADLTYRRGKAHEGSLDPVIQRYEWARRLLAAWAKGEQDVPGLTPATGTGGDIAIGAGINPYGGRLFDTENTFPQPPPYGDDVFYHPDAYRWGEARGWY